jgi:uncharacterized protein
MGEYKSPGVYVEEVPSAIKAIAGVSTSTAAFIGVAPDKINLVAKDDPGSDGKPKTKFVEFNLLAADKEPKLITNWTQFTKQFGDLIGDSSEAAVSGGTPAIDIGHRNLAHAVYGFFNNGGSRCFVTRISDPNYLDAALAALAAIDEVALVAAPGMIDDATRNSLVIHCDATKDRFAIFDGPQSVDDLTKLTKTAAEGGGTTAEGAGTAAGLAPTNTDLAAWYFPWVKVFDPAAKLLAPDGDGSINVPPSGHIAGVYARVDVNRGVFKAPANEPIMGVLGVSQPISKPEQDGLNLQGVNCIRALNGNIFVWGARTVGGDANADLKYINVRRTLLFLRESIDEGMQWAVFEPNTPGLWQKITRNITAFLTNVWRSGALFGDTAQEAFYVKCDAENNPPELRELGQVVTEIGVAIARPAEFVIFRLSQFTGPAN